MTTDDNIKEEKLQYNINREETKISALLSGKIDDYLTYEKILPSDQSKMKEQQQAKFTASSL